MGSKLRISWAGATATVDRFCRTRRGAIALFLAIGIVPLIGVLALGTDAARGYLVKARLSQAVDAAGLAAAKMIFDDTEYPLDAVRFRDANFPPGFMGATITEWSVNKLGTNNDQLEVFASARIPTTFMRVLGVTEITVSARTLVQRSVRGLELALVMDNTGSMRGGGSNTDVNNPNKMLQMKLAAAELVQILYGDRETVPNFWVSLVPYAAMVNIGNNNTGWLVNYDPADYSPTTWKGCVLARSAPLDSTDDIPAVQGFDPFLWLSTIGDAVVDPFRTPVRDYNGTKYIYGGDNEWDPSDPSTIDESNGAQNNGTGPNLGCGPAITPLVAEKSAVLTAINGMDPWHRGGTMANIGLAWGWRSISPAWQGLWGDPELPKAYDESLMDKAVVILTDGNNQWYDWPGDKITRTDFEYNGQTYPTVYEYTGLPGNTKQNGSVESSDGTPPGADYTAYRRLNEGLLGTTSNSAAKTEVNNRMTSICTAMKAQGIIIYTITFNLADGSTKNLYKNCATTPEYHFDAGSGTELQEAFKAIGTELSNLRIAE